MKGAQTPRLIDPENERDDDPLPPLPVPKAPIGRVRRRPSRTQRSIPLVGRVSPDGPNARCHVRLPPDPQRAQIPDDGPVLPAVAGIRPRQISAHTPLGRPRQRPADTLRLLEFISVLIAFLTVREQLC